MVGVIVSFMTTKTVIDIWLDNKVKVKDNDGSLSNQKLFVIKLELNVEISSLQNS